MNKLKTLVVEDIASIRKVLDEALGGQVFDKRFAADGNEALNIYHQWKPDLILLDMVLPVMTGYSVLKHIRQEAKDKATAVIMQTTMADKEDVKECIKLGIQGYILKPFDPTEIAHRVLKYFEASDMKRAQAAREELERTRAVSHLVQPLGSGETNKRCNSFAMNESEYMEEVRFCLQDGTISEDERKLLERQQGKLGLAEERAAQLEVVVQEEKGGQYTSRELEYMEELKFCLEDGQISEDERRILGRLRQKLKLSEGRAAELEASVSAS